MNSEFNNLYVKVFYKIDPSNGAQIGSSFKSNNPTNWNGQYTNGMILNNGKIYIAYYWTVKGLIVYDIQLDSFTSSYEYSSSTFNMNSIIIYNSRLFSFGWNTGTTKAIISSAKTADLSLVPDVILSSFKMNPTLPAQYSLSSVTITNNWK